MGKLFFVIANNVLFSVKLKENVLFYVMHFSLTHNMGVVANFIFSQKLPFETSLAHRAGLI